MVVVVAFLQYHADQSILACGFGVLDWLEEEVVENAHLIQDVVEESIFDLNICHLFDV